MKAVLIACVLVIISAPAFAAYDHACVGYMAALVKLRGEADAAMAGRYDPDPAKSAAWQADHAAYDAAVAAYENMRQWLDACQATMQAAPPRQVGTGPRQLPPNSGL